MYFKSKKISLLILGAAAFISSRTMLTSFDDPEGPNLLIVTVLALVLYFVSWSVYRYNPSETGAFQQLSFSSLSGFKRLLLAISIQILIAVTLYFCLR